MIDRQEKLLVRTGTGSHFVRPPVRWAWEVALAAGAIASAAGGVDQGMSLRPSATTTQLHAVKGGTSPPQARTQSGRRT